MFPRVAGIFDGARGFPDALLLPIDAAHRSCRGLQPDFAPLDHRDDVRGAAISDRAANRQILWADL